MDWSDTPEQAAFRSEVRTLIAERLPARYRRLGANPHAGERVWENDRKSDDPERREAAVEWVRALAERGWVAPHWPTEYGGAGLGPMDTFILNQEMAEAAIPVAGSSGVNMLGPTLILHGTEEQKQEHLPKILHGEVAWAQGYSEPGAGSDLASLQTRAARDGDEYVVNGQKIWTSAAHLADSLFVLVRTDPDAAKHRGISFLMLDAKAPGVSVRPLIDMGDNHYFNETYFDDVRVPVRNRVGEENRGWYVAMTLLDFERSNIGSAVATKRVLRKLLEHLRTAEGRAGSRVESSGALRGELAERWIETEVLFQFSFRVISMQHAGLVPNDEASVTKMFSSELSQRAANTSMKLFGLYANLWGEQPRAPLKGSYARAYVGAVPATIRGGTSEIQRNIIATRGLGLPRG